MAGGRRRPTAMRLLIPILLVATISLPSEGSVCSATSGPKTAALVELYTSEGCSSCPPADRWLSGFTKPGADARVVPIAFHVQYWDYIGWKDAFGDPRYTERQHAVAERARARNVYTPQVVVGGRDFPDWRSAGAFGKSVEAIAGRDARATLVVDARVAPDGTVRGWVETTLRDPVGREALQVHVVALQDGLSSSVTAGENRGERLRHDYVARDFVAAPLRGARERTPFTFTPKPGWDARRLSLAAFVQDRGTGEVLQAVATGACR
jgi:hypothetical protein